MFVAWHVCCILTFLLYTSYFVRPTCSIQVHPNWLAMKPNIAQLLSSIPYQAWLPHELSTASRDMQLIIKSQKRIRKETQALSITFPVFCFEMFVLIPHTATFPLHIFMRWRFWSTSNATLHEDFPEEAWQGSLMGWDEAETQGAYTYVVIIGGGYWSLFPNRRGHFCYCNRRCAGIWTTVPIATLEM